MADKAALLAAVQNPNVRVFLDLLADAEGVQHGYNTGFGNIPIASLDDHPRARAGFTQTDGKRNVTTAAGRYQFLERTWDDVAGKLGLTDFGPASQDLAAVELLRRNGALPLILAGDFQGAVARSGSTWASLPSSPYAQNKRSNEFVTARLPPSTTPATVPTLSPGMQSLVSAVGPAGTPAATPPLKPVPASNPDAVKQLLEAMVPTPAQLTLPGLPEPELTPDDEADLLAALSTDTRAARDKALANFTGEAYVPEIELPPEIDATINRYLAQL